MRRCSTCGITEANAMIGGMQFACAHQWETDQFLYDMSHLDQATRKYVRETIEGCREQNRLHAAAPIYEDALKSIAAGDPWGKGCTCPTAARQALQKGGAKP